MKHAACVVLASAGLFGELLIRFEYLTHTGRADRMAIRNQTTARVHRNLERKLAGLLIPNLRQGGCAAFHKLDAFARLGESENFASDNFCNRKAIVHFGALHIARLQVCHRKCLFCRFTCGRERGRVFFIKREIIGGVTVAEQTGRLALIGADFVHIFFRNEND